MRSSRLRNSNRRLRQSLPLLREDHADEREAGDCFRRSSSSALPSSLARLREDHADEREAGDCFRRWRAFAISDPVGVQTGDVTDGDFQFFRRLAVVVLIDFPGGPQLLPVGQDQLPDDAVRVVVFFQHALKIFQRD